MIAIEWPQLQKILTLVALASGRAKTHAIIGALRSKLVDILVTDEDTARLVLGAAR